MTCSSDVLLNDLRSRQAELAVVGLGYVGLPLACCLAKRFRVVGFDINRSKITRLRAGHDPIGEVGDAGIAASGIAFTDAAEDLRRCRFFIIAVPTPVDTAKRPDFTPLVQASKLVGAHMPAGSIVVYESTVYPGATEEVCVPILAAASGLQPGAGFTYGYSPERINPGDREHTIERITKVVSGSDAATLACVAGVYGDAIQAGVFRAVSVQVAEAAKVIENTQRDLNIALMNELALIFHRIGIDTNDVLAAARSKWNFLPFTPGLVGGHCIGVDPYYLTHKAQEQGYHPEVILAGRRINDGMGVFVAQECVRLLARRGRPILGARVLILGLTFKEDCPDVRNTKVVDIIAELRRFGCEPVVIDPVADAAEAEHEYGLKLVPGAPLPMAEAAIVAVAHKQFCSLTPAQLAAALPPGAPVLDVKAIVDREAAAAAGIELWRL
jgi:UDP-N-acetyl-D-galactosamine dehydrogenase